MKQLNLLEGFSKDLKIQQICTSGQFAMQSINFQQLLILERLSVDIKLKSYKLQGVITKQISSDTIYFRELCLNLFGFFAITKYNCLFAIDSVTFVTQSKLKVAYWTRHPSRPQWQWSRSQRLINDHCP